MAESDVKSLSESIYSQEDIRSRIYTIRGSQVMLDSDLAAIYGYSTTAFNQQVKNNAAKFEGDDFMFQLSHDEYIDLISKNLTSSWGGRRKLPYAFTESGIYMLMTVLKGELAIMQSRTLIRAFRDMIKFLTEHGLIFQRLDRIELKQLEADEKFNQIFNQLEAPRPDKSVIFFKGQMWDATSCIEDIIGRAKEAIILIDGYVDKNTLDMICGKKSGVSATIYTIQKNCKVTEKEFKDFNSQYGPLEIKYTDEFHDRFLILDNKELYHIGASIKDAGKKAFEISLNEDRILLDAILKRL